MIPGRKLFKNVKEVHNNLLKEKIEGYTDMIVHLHFAFFYFDTTYPYQRVKNFHSNSLLQKA
jgi:hypothetical protein